MACETPYGRPSWLGHTEPEVPAVQGESRLGSGGRRWSFPPAVEAPLSLRGELVVSCGEFDAGSWELGWAQLIGQKHRHCEDSIGIAWTEGLPVTTGCLEPTGVTLALADGVGGGSHGEVASRVLVQHCLDLGLVSVGLTGQLALTAGLLQADSVVNRALAALTPAPGAATLAAAWLAADGRGWICRVGDARLSVWRPCDACWQPLLADQSYVNLGETAPSPEHQHAPARMVGAGLMGKPEVVPFSLAAEEVLMLSSDGLHQWLDPLAWAATPLAGWRMRDLARAMALRSRELGGDDDISLVLARRRPQRTE